MYLAGRCDNSLPIGVTLKDLSELANEKDAHLHSVELLFAFRGWQRGRQEDGGQRHRQALNH